MGVEVALIDTEAPAEALPDKPLPVPADTEPLACTEAPPLEPELEPPDADIDADDEEEEVVEDVDEEEEEEEEEEPPLLLLLPPLPLPPADMEPLMGPNWPETCTSRFVN